MTDEPQSRWRIFKRGAGEHSEVIGYWKELATLDSEYVYSAPGPQQVGELGGPGEYLLLRDDLGRAEQFVVEGRTRYEKVDPPEDEPTVVGAWPAQEQDA